MKDNRRHQILQERALREAMLRERGVVILKSP